MERLIAGIPVDETVDDVRHPVPVHVTSEGRMRIGGRPTQIESGRFEFARKSIFRSAQEVKRVPEAEDVLLRGHPEQVDELITCKISGEELVLIPSDRVV